MTDKNIFSTTELEKEIEQLKNKLGTNIIDIYKTPRQEKWFKELILKEDTLKERQRLGAIVKKDWIEKKEVERVIDESKQTSGFIGIGEWEDSKDIDLFYAFLEEFKSKLGLSQEEK